MERAIEAFSELDERNWKTSFILQIGFSIETPDNQVLNRVQIRNGFPEPRLDNEKVRNIYQKYDKERVWRSFE